MALPFFTIKKDQNTTRDTLEEQSLEHTEADERGMLDIPFLVLTLLLVIIGVIMMFSASYAAAYHEKHDSTFYFANQGRYAILGIACMVAASFFPYRALKRLAVPGIALAGVLLVLVLLKGIAGGGATRWFSIGNAFSFQPSEAAKLAVIVFLASVFTTFPRSVIPFQKGFFLWLFTLVGICLLIVIEPHISATFIIALVAGMMMLFAGMDKKWLLLGVGLAGVLLIIFILSKGYASERLAAHNSLEENATGSAYQIIQSLNAIGSGGLMGLGFGKSRQKYLYLPEGHNDYVFSIICEELGFVGVVVVLLLFAMLILRGYWIALHAKERFGALLAAGFTTLTAVQVILNIAVVTNTIPSTGISLPFFSYGGTALVIQLIEMGIVLNVSRSCTNKLI